MSSNFRQLWQVNKYLWMALVFVLAYIPVARQRGLLSAPLWSVGVLFVLGVANVALRSYVGFRNAANFTVPRPQRETLSWVFTFGDMLLISVAIGLTKGLQSDLWLLYFITMISESLYASPRQTRLIAVLVAFAYIFATVPVQEFGPRLSSLEFYSVLATRLFFLISIGAFARRISYHASLKNNELLLLREQMAAGEERTRIAREIHDSLGHSLVTIILRLELAAKLVRKQPREAETLLNEEIVTLRAAWNDGRDLAFHLRPWEMTSGEAGSLPETLRRHIGRFAERTGAIIEFKIDETEAWDLPPTTAFGLTRIVQEALTNAVRHGKASRIEVELRHEARNHFRATIHDNGQGFEPGQPEGTGLQTMRERAEKLGGTLDIESSPGSGTTVAIGFSV